MVRLLARSLLSLFIASSAMAFTGSTRSIMEGVPATNNAILVTTATASPSITSPNIIGTLSVTDQALPANQCVQTTTGGLLSTTGGTCAAAAGGGGATSLAVFSGAVQVSSPTAIINFSTTTFTVTLAGSATAQVSLNPTGVILSQGTLQTGTSFYVLQGTAINMTVGAGNNGNQLTLSGGANASSNVMMTVLPNGTSTGTGAKILFGEQSAVNTMGEVESVDTGSASQGIVLNFYTSRNASVLNKSMTIIGARSGADYPAVGINTAVPAGVLDVQTMDPGGVSSIPVVNSNNTFAHNTGLLYRGQKQGSTVYSVDQNGVINSTSLTASQFVKTDGSSNLVSYDILNGTQSWTGGNTFSSMTVIGSGITVGNGAGVGNLTLGNLSALAYRTASPSWVFDVEGQVADGGILTHWTDSGGIVMYIEDTGNFPAGQFVNNVASGNNSWALTASKLGAGIGAAKFTVDVSTAGVFSASSGTGGLFSSGSGAAIQVDSGGVFLRPLTASVFVKTDANKNLSSYDLLGGNQNWTGSNTFTSSTTVAGLSSTAHLNVRSSVPSVSSCGAGPSIVGTDNAGTVTEGSGSPTSCTVTFANLWTSTPFCVATTTSTVVQAAVSSISTSQFVISSGVSLGSDSLTYICVGKD